MKNKIKNPLEVFIKELNPEFPSLSSNISPTLSNLYLNSTMEYL
jgi:hypothetical protein